MSRIAKQAQRTWGDAERCPSTGLWLPESLRRGKFKLLEHNRFGNCAPQMHPRFTNPTIAGVEDVVNQPLYDTVTAAQGAAFPLSSIFFTSGLSTGKTKNQTNMKLNGVLPAPQRMFLQAYRLYVGNDAAPADLIAFLRNTFLVFSIGSKPYFEGPSWMLSAGAGALISASSQLGVAPTGAAPTLATSNGTPDQRSIFSLSQPFMLEQGEAFQVELNTGSAFNLNAATTNPPGTGLTITCVLDGELYRGVQ